MRRLFLICILINITTVFAGKETKYLVSEISAELKKNSKAVVRENNLLFTVESPSKGTLEVKSVVTIMNKAGDYYSELSLSYNKFIKYRNIKATFYDQNGNEIKSLKKSDLIDVPSISGYSLYEDHRRIMYDPDITSYPFTAEYTYTVDFNGLFTYPDLTIYDDYNVSIEKSIFEIRMPKDIELKIFFQNMDTKSTEISTDKYNSYRWETFNKSVIEDEPFSPSFENFQPKVCFAPSKFEVDGVPGSMNSWYDFGQWISTLNMGKNNLTPETKSRINELVEGAKSDSEKIAILYKYMQNKTRYVNITVGLGGWQPIDAQTVDRLSYGDCKALSNYMVSLLETVGIKSYYTLVNAGSYTDNIISEFAMNQFNHAIVCVPMQNDTLWLECTNQRVPVGYIGDFTDDRMALVIQEGNSSLVRTKAYKKEENVQLRNIRFNLNCQGEGNAEIKTTYHGLKTEKVFHLLHSDPEDVKRYLYNNLNLSNFDLHGFNYSYKDSIIPSVYETLNLNVKSYASVMGNRLIIPVNMMSKIEQLPKKIAKRNTNVLVRRSRIDVDSVDFVIPTGYSVEASPSPVEIKSKYGDYKLSLTSKDGVVTCVRSYSLNKGDYDPIEYNDFRGFLDAISKADNLKFTIVKK
jgi:transglutaminase-like putative cysteine protease